MPQPLMDPLTQLFVVGFFRGLMEHRVLLTVDFDGHEDPYRTAYASSRCRGMT